ncbi:MAG: hypothetical protein QX197_04770 [Methylococcaceae bacterium]
MTDLLQLCDKATNDELKTTARLRGQAMKESGASARCSSLFQQQGTSTTAPLH